MTKFHAKLIVGDIKIGVQVKGNVIGNIQPLEIMLFREARNTIMVRSLEEITPRITRSGYDPKPPYK